MPSRAPFSAVYPKCLFTRQVLPRWESLQNNIQPVPLRRDIFPRPIRFRVPSAPCRLILPRREHPNQHSQFAHAVRALQVPSALPALLFQSNVDLVHFAYPDSFSASHQCLARPSLIFALSMSRHSHTWPMLVSFSVVSRRFHRPRHISVADGQLQPRTTALHSKPPRTPLATQPESTPPLCHTPPCPQHLASTVAPGTLNASASTHRPIGSRPLRIL